MEGLVNIVYKISLISYIMMRLSTSLSLRQAILKKSQARTLVGSFLKGFHLNMQICMILFRLSSNIRFYIPRYDLKLGNFKYPLFICCLAMDSGLSGYNWYTFQLKNIMTSLQAQLRSGNTCFLSCVCFLIMYCYSTEFG